MRKKVLITGGAGALGCNLTSWCLERGDEVMVLDDMSTAVIDGFEPHPSLQMHVGDIGDIDWLSGLVRDFGPTHIIHAAASYNDPDAWERDVRVNLIATCALIKCAQQLNVARFIYLQTAICYGDPEMVPTPEKAPFSPVGSYAISKTAAEHYLEISGLSYVSLRLPIVYGPYHFSGPIPIFYNRLSQGKPCFATEAIREFMALSDFLNAVARVMDAEAPVGCFNVGGGEAFSIKDVYDVIARALGMDPVPEIEVRPRAEGDVAAMHLESSLFRDVFNWAPMIPFEEGVPALVEWYKAHGTGASFSHHKVASAPAGGA